LRLDFLPLARLEQVLHEVIRHVVNDAPAGVPHAGHGPTTRNALQLSHEGSPFSPTGGNQKRIRARSIVPVSARYRAKVRSRSRTQCLSCASENASDLSRSRWVAASLMRRTTSASS